MEKLDLEASVRQEKVNKVRAKGFVPAVVYGRGFGSLQVEIENKKISALFSAGSNKNILISLNVKDSEKSYSIPVLTQEMQIDPLTDKVLHIDFLKISMEEEIKTKVSIVLVGEAAGVKLDGGILVQPLRQLEVKCLPGNIPEKITVDVSDLKIGQSIHISDIAPPEGVTIITGKEEAVAIVTSPTKEEEAAPAEAAAIEGAPAEGAAPPVEGVVTAPAAGAPAAAAGADAKTKAAPAAAGADAKAKGQAKPAKPAK